MTGLGIDPPPKFMECPGIPAIPWDEWQSLWSTYADAIDADQFSAKRKTALLLHCLGTEGQKRYAKLKELEE